MDERREMEPEDWMSAAFNVVTGLLLGLALDGLLGLFVDGFWFVAVGTAVIGGATALVLLAFDGILKRATDRIFPSGVQAPRSAKPKGRTPFARLLSLPLGLALGMILAQLGLTQTILDLF